MDQKIHRFKKNEAWIESQMNLKKTELNNVIDNIKTFLESNPIFFEESKAKLLSEESEIETINSSIDEFNQKNIMLQEELSNLDSQMIKEVTYDKPIQKELLELQKNKALMLTSYGRENIKIIQLTAQIKSLQELIENGSENLSNTTILVSNPRYYEIQNIIKDNNQKIKILSARKSNINKKLIQTHSEFAEAPGQGLIYERLQTSKNSLLNEIQTLTSSLQSSKLERTALQNEVVIVETPNDRSNKIVPYKFNLYQLGLIGFIFGVVICFLVEKLNSSIRKASDIIEGMGSNLLSIIPHNTIRQNLNATQDNSTIDDNNAEPYRRLLTNFNYSHKISNGNKSILVTSALQGEGKTTTAALISMTIGMNGDKVLLIDADLRRKGIHSIVGVPNTDGLSECLSSDTQWQNVVKNSKFSNLSVLTAGQDKLALTKPAHQRKFSKILQEMYKEYDYVIIDSAPALKISDTLSIATMADQVLLVFKSEQTPIKAGVELFRQLGSINANIIGCVLNDVSTTFWDKYYYEYYNYGYYGYYYNQEDPS